MSGKGIVEFLDYWEREGLRYAQRGDYDWMASLVPGSRVLEIGCGPGFSTVALGQRGLSVLVLESLPTCLEVARLRTQGLPVAYLQADIAALSSADRAAIEAFAPEAIVCWLMGAPAEVSGAQTGDGGRAVVAYRERVHRQVAELAGELPTVQALHFVDRTAIAWQAKDIGRDTLVRYHLGKTLLGLPFTTDRRQALYRKIEDNATTMMSNRNLPAAMRGAVPTLASLLVERKN